MSEILRPFYDKGILFPDLVAWLPLAKEEGKVVISHGVNNDSSNLREELHRGGGCISSAGESLKGEEEELTAFNGPGCAS